MATQSATTRRSFSKFLLGAGVAATARMPTVAPASAHPTGQIADLIEQHRAAWQRFEDFCGIEDHECKTEYYPLNFAEEEALNAVCSHRAQTLEDARTKAAYLNEFLKHSELTREQERMFFRSFLPSAA